jgi:hypothetical protein
MAIARENPKAQGHHLSLVLIRSSHAVRESEIFLSDGL